MLSFWTHRLAILTTFALVLASPAAAAEDEPQGVRGKKSMFKIADQHSGPLSLDDSPLQDETKSWERILKKKGSNHNDPEDSSDDEPVEPPSSPPPEDSSDDEPDEPQACPTPTPVDAEVVRAALKAFVSTLDEASDLQPTRLERGYHPNAADQGQDYHMCTVVQQCLDPPFILSLGHMSAKSRGLAYKAVSKVMSQESFNMLQLQQHSNMLLGEMQDWATTCPGTCRQLLNFDGLLDPVPGGPGSLAAQSRGVGLVSYEECGDYRSQGFYTFWHCNEEPRMVHQAQIDVATGQYFLGNIWGEPHIHARNSWYDYFSAYGDLEENGGAFGLRFSGHHIDLNYRWNDEGVLVQDLPVFLGHNPLIVPEVSPPELRDHDQRADADQFYFPLMWTNMAGVAQFAESEQLVLSCANQLLDIAPGSYVPLSNWTSTGYVGALQLLGQKITDFDYFDLSTASDSEFEKMWALVEYTLKFSRGKEGLSSAERAIFRAEGKALWTTSSPPEEGLPLTEDDLRSNLNFLNLRIETEDWVFFVMVNQLFTVISENEPTNHMHSVLIPKELISAEHACIAEGDPLCVAPPREEDDDHHTERIASAYKYESLLWEERNLKGNVTLNVSAFDEALIEVSEELCDLGITATLFDENAEQIYQKTVGTRYFDFNGYLNHSDEQAGWNGDTRMSLYSNSKIVTAATFLAAVIDTGLGYLDEPIYLTFPEILTEDDVVGRATPRMLLSHTSGIASYQRANSTDPYYKCIYDDTKTFPECLGEFLLTDDTITDVPGTQGTYRNEPFDVIAEITTRKTGLNNFGEAFQKYVAGPIGMDDTTIDCLVVQSTSQKPHPSWGFCSTANDMAKLVQVLANKGKKPDGTQVIPTYSVQQAFTSATGFASNGDSPLVGNFAISRCYNRVPESGYVNSIVGYGLGTMFIAGPKGLLMAHAGTSGGLWVVAPGRYSAYFGWMNDPDGSISAIAAYGLVNSIVDRFEVASTFMVANGGTFDGTSEWEEIETCGPYVDWWSIYGLTATPWRVSSCSSTRRTAETRGSGEIEFEETFLEEMAETFRDL